MSPNFSFWPKTELQTSQTPPKTKQFANIKGFIPKLSSIYEYFFYLLQNTITHPFTRSPFTWSPVTQSPLTQNSVSAVTLVRSKNSTYVCVFTHVFLHLRGFMKVKFEKIKCFDAVTLSPPFTRFLFSRKSRVNGFWPKILSVNHVWTEDLLTCK